MPQIVSWVLQIPLVANKACLFFLFFPPSSPFPEALTLTSRREPEHLRANCIIFLLNRLALSKVPSDCDYECFTEATLGVTLV